MKLKQMNKLYNAYSSLADGCHIPRKIKKMIIGKKISKSKLKSMLSSVKITKQKYPEPAKIEPFAFCPKCGCYESWTYDHGVPYPEVWIEDICLRCKSVVGSMDNSPYYHALEDIVENVN